MLAISSQNEIMRRIADLIFKISFIFLLTPGVCFAQSYVDSNSGYGAGSGSSSVDTKGFKRDFATIVFGGIAGGVLGLSTLSFYGEPQEHTNNITVGALLGMVFGATYVFYNRYEPRGRATIYDNYGAIDQQLLLQKQTLLATIRPPQVQINFEF